MKQVVATLVYCGKQYTVSHPIEDDYADDEHLLFLWEEGNYACDDNRANFIRNQVDPAFPVFTCGETIDLIELTLDGRDILTPSVNAAAAEYDAFLRAWQSRVLAAFGLPARLLYPPEHTPQK